ncbi:MAG: LamG-like jellyroll fold domain-containing protein [Chitinophagales bacterium]
MESKISHFLWASTLSLFFALHSFAQMDLNQDLVAYYSLNDHATDGSPMSIEGVINGAIAEEGLSGLSNNALYFNGKDATVSCGVDNRGIDNVASISTWIKTTNDKIGYIVCKYNWEEDSGFHLGVNDGHVRFGGRNKSGVYTNAASNAVVNDGEWHHVLGVVHENVWQIWIDGDFDTSVESNSQNPSLANSEVLSIGNYPYGYEGNHKYFEGVIDEVRIYNRLLSNREIIYLSIPKKLAVEQRAVSDKFEVLLFPNPTKKTFRVEAENLNIDKIEIWNLAGIKIRQYIEPNGDIDISFLPKGTYWVRCYDSGLGQVVTRELAKSN